MVVEKQIMVHDSTINFGDVSEELTFTGKEKVRNSFVKCDTQNMLLANNGCSFVSLA